MLRATLCFCLIIITAGSVFSENSFGPTFGCLTTADACGFGNGYLGGFIAYGEDVRILFGSLTYGFSDYTEGRFSLGFADPDFTNDNPAITFGGDLKYEIMDFNDTRFNHPFDMAMGVFGEYTNYKEMSTMGLGAYAVGSLPYQFKNGQRLIPYSRLCFRWEKVKSDHNDFNSDSNYRLGLNLGAKFEVIKDMNIFGEIQLDGNRGILLGVDFRAL
ncbi:MAG: hypothetical protein ABIJ45_05750 [Candidatus Zixiibacteriota bacterium]